MKMTMMTVAICLLALLTGCSDKDYYLLPSANDVQVEECFGQEVNDDNLVVLCHYPSNPHQCPQGVLVKCNEAKKYLANGYSGGYCVYDKVCISSDEDSDD